MSVRVFATLLLLGWAVLTQRASAAPIPVRMVVVATFETGRDTGDAPGEFQFWVEREHMGEVIPERGALHPIRRNRRGLYGLVPGDAGHMVDAAGEALCAFVLDPRFDFRKTYWLFTGISGTDPRVATIGTAAWASFVVDGDELRELDDREAPKDWPYGLFAIGADRPDMRPSDPKHFGSATDVAPLDMGFPLNASLTRWAYALTRNVRLPDTAALAAIRAKWVGFPAGAGATRGDHGRHARRAPLLAWCDAYQMGRAMGLALDARPGPVRDDQHGKPELRKCGLHPRQAGTARSGPRDGAANGEQFFRARAGRVACRKCRRRRRRGSLRRSSPTIGLVRRWCMRSWRTGTGMRSMCLEEGKGVVRSTPPA